jgi:hypothetical protein
MIPPDDAFASNDRGTEMSQPDQLGNESVAERAIALLARVQARLRTISFARSFYRASLAAILLGVIAVTAVRLLGLVAPADQRPEWLLAIPFASLIIAGLFYRRVEKTSAARAIDDHAKTRDLFLTLSTLSSSAGEFQPLVAQSAQKVAERIAPEVVVPYRFARPLGKLIAAAAVFALLVQLLPQLDPFGKVEASLKAEAQKKELAEMRRAAKIRKEELEKKIRVDEENSKELDNQVEGLKSALRAMKPKEQQANSKVLQTKKNELGDQWKMASTEELRKLLSQQAQEQQFGGARSQKMNEWLKDLQEGRSDQLQKEMQKAEETMQAMMEAKTAEEREKLASQLKRELQDLKKFASEKASSKELTAALDKAIKALEAAKQGQKNSDGSKSDEQMTQEAMEALKESMELSKTELQELARNAGDLKKLEEALKTLQQAEQLNQQGQLDGEQCEGCQTLAEYAEMYRQMMGENPGEGEGTGNPGFGKGGQAPEDDSDPEGYKDEKTKTQVQAGKVLLSIKTKEYATEKDFNPEDLRQYEESVSAIKSGVQAAIEGEQVPPGYVDGIKGYFDRIDATRPASQGVLPSGTASDASSAAETPATVPSEAPAAEPGK